MRLTKQFLRENLLGLSLTFIGVLCLALSAISYMGHRGYPHFAVAGGAGLGGGAGLDGPDIDMLERQNKAYERIAEAVTPAIVSIQSTTVVKVQQSPFFTDPLFRQFFGDMFGGQFGIPRNRVEHALGSGLIVGPDGYILTNNHVVGRAKEIDVMLSDKRTFKGQVVGRDSQTDIAVVKIQAKDLPTVALGDSSTLHVGDTVMAFGNPFGLDFTVTRGTVSALGRSRGGIEEIQNFIQTDAAINPGNSGGALVNVRGQAVGINTAIVSGSSGPGGEGSFLGIGFAIPVNMARHVMQDLIKTGKVTRGYLGVEIGIVDEKLAQEFNVPDTSGAFVQDVTPGGPADKAGLKAGDVIRKLNGQTVEDHNQLTAAVTSMNPGTEVTLNILREGKPLTLKVKLGERPTNLSVRAGLGNVSQGTLQGIRVQNLTPSMREQLGLPASTRGVVISELDPNSPAAQAGLQPGDVIESINRRPVNSATDFVRFAAEAKGRTLVRINRQGEGVFVVISPSGGEDDGSQ